MTNIDSSPGDRTPVIGRVDFTMMYVAHDAFVRDLRRLASACAEGHSWEPETTARWAMFEKQLHIHHTAEDNSLWPRLRKAPLSDDEVTVVEAMAAEHEQIDPLLEAIADAFADRDAPALTDNLRALTVNLAEHMEHEERQALPLVAKHLGPLGWAAFGRDIRQTQGIRGGATYLPWVLDEASHENRRRVLGILPLPVRLAFRLVWEPRYHRAS